MVPALAALAAWVRAALAALAAWVRATLKLAEAALVREARA